MKNDRVHVHVPLKSNARHLQQMYTGLETLHKQGLIKLSYSNRSQKENNVYTDIIIGEKRVVIDCKDSVQIEMKDYEECDFYFKRSLSPSHYENFSKLEPFGLYFEVYPSIRSIFTIKRFLEFSKNTPIDKVKSIVKAIDVSNILSYLPRVEDFFSQDETVEDIPILFFTRLWNPYIDREFELSDEETRDRERINALRIDCLRALRLEFGEDSAVGLLDDEFSRRLAPDLILPPSSTDQRNYFKLVKRSKVCITSTGLHGSIGAKFSEYLALGKLILSEPFEHVLENPVKEGVNYLSYSSPKECVEKVKSMLVTGKDTEAMTYANRQYSAKHLLPDQIMRRVIEKVYVN